MDIRERAGAETTQRLEALAVSAEREVAARKEAAEAWDPGSNERTGHVAIAQRREADAQALRSALALAAYVMRVTGPEMRERLTGDLSRVLGRTIADRLSEEEGGMLLHHLLNAIEAAVLNLPERPVPLAQVHVEAIAEPIEFQVAVTFDANSAGPVKDAARLGLLSAASESIVQELPGQVPAGSRVTLRIDAELEIAPLKQPTPTAAP